MSQYLLFVFGTLKEGFPNYRYNCGVRLPGVFVTKTKYPLHLVGERHSPWMIDSPGEGAHVAGQVFTVNKSELTKMDNLERTHEPDGYSRKKISVVNRSSNAVLEVFVYLKSPVLLTSEPIMRRNLASYEFEDTKMYRSR